MLLFSATIFALIVATFYYLRIAFFQFPKISAFGSRWPKKSMTLFLKYFTVTYFENYGKVCELYKEYGKFNDMYN